MKKYLLFVVSISFAFGFTSNAFGKGGRASDPEDYVIMLKEVEVKGPFVVEVDYAAPLDDLIEKIPYKTRPLKNEALIASYSGRAKEQGKVRREIYLVRVKKEDVWAYLPEIRKGLKEGSVIPASKDNVMAAIAKKAPQLRPAGPYELFSFAFAHGQSLEDKASYTVLSDVLQPDKDMVESAKNRLNAWFSSGKEKYRAQRALEDAEKVAYSEFSARYYDGSIQIFAFSSDFGELVPGGDYTVYMK
jgi:hypothetical protein